MSDKINEEMDQSSFIEYALRYLLVPGQRVGAREAIARSGFSEALPDDIERLLARSDDLGHTLLVLTESDPLMMQWNPFTGVSPLYTSSPFGAALLGNHRWMQGIHDSMVKVIYEVIHESVHAVWAALGLRGLLTQLPPHERGDLHQLVEASAVLFGDLEAHEQLRQAESFERVWPTGASRTHAVNFSPLEALKAAGLGSEERAQWLFSVYLDQARSLPHRPEHPGLRAQALAFLIEECSYAEKSQLTTTPQWIRRYWERVEIEAYLRDFVPPAPLEIPCVPEPITSIDQCRRYWREIMLSDEQLPPTELAYQRARLKIQRVGLKVSELIGALDSYRLCSPEPERAQVLQLVNEARDDLSTAMRSHLWSPRGSMSEVESQRLIGRADSTLSDLKDVVQSALGACLVFEHPHLDGLPFKENLPPLTSRDLSSRDLSSQRSFYQDGRDESRERAELSELLKLIVDESRITYQHLSRALTDDSVNDSVQRRELKSILERCREVYQDAHRLIGALELDDSPSLCHEIEQLFNAVKDQRSLWLVYPVEWLSGCPFIDPLIGFRYR